MHQEPLITPGVIIINLATSYIVFSRCVLIGSKASKHRCSHSPASFDNAVCRTAHSGLTLYINKLGASRMPRLGVVALANGITITGERRLDP